MTDAKQLKDKLAKKFRTANLEFKAVLGRSDGQVISLETDASPEDVYVTLYNGSVISLHNDRVPRVPFRKVVVGYDDRDSELFQVLRFDNLYTTRPHPNVANHKDSHTWFGYDPVDVYKEQVMPLLPRAASGLNIIIYGGGYLCNGLYHIMPTKTLDLTAEAVSSGAEWVNVEIDASGTITYQHSSNVASRALLTPEMIPATSTAKKLLCSVMMYAGQSEIVQTRIDTDIFDPRLTGQDSTAPMLSDLSDVLIDSYLADGDVLVWDNYLNLFVNQPQAVSSFSWITVTADGTLTVNTGHYADKATLLTVALPATASKNDIIRIIGVSAGLFKITQAASQVIYFGNQTTTTGTGGYIQSIHDRDAIELVCVADDLEWQVISSVGNFEVA